MKKFKISLLAAFLITMVGVLMIGGATVAWFTSEAENTGNSFAAGTLEVSLDKPDGTKYFEIRNIAPGDGGSAEITVINTGSLELRYDFAFEKSGLLFEGTHPLNVSIENGNRKMVVLPSNDQVLAAGEKEIFTIAWEIPEDADNTYQGQAGILGIVVDAEQTTAP